MIYDCFTFFNELDLLELRLHEMNSVVDRFVIVESKVTFQGNEKPLHYRNNQERFAKFRDKIIHVVSDGPNREELEGYRTTKSEAFAREYYQRDQFARGLAEAKPDDMIIVSDVDEILSAKRLSDVLADNAAAYLAVFPRQDYHFFVNRALLKQKNLLGPRMVRYDRYPGGQLLRNSRGPASRSLEVATWRHVHARLWNAVNCRIALPIKFVTGAVWHFTSIGGWEKWRAKVDAYAHEERKEGALYKNEKAIETFIQKETRSVPIHELPEYVMQNKERFPFYEAH